LIHIPTDDEIIGGTHFCDTDDMSSTGGTGNDEGDDAAAAVSSNWFGVTTPAKPLGKP
jgi:hypothetical protein